MLSVLIETCNHEEELARTLASLVGGAVEGVVREVIVCDTGSTDNTHLVAEHAGCRYVAEGGIGTALRQAKGEWLALLEPGARLCDGWMDGVLDHVARSTAPACFTRSKQGRAKFLVRVFSAKRPLADGLLITKRQAAALVQKARHADDIARGLAMKRLDGEIFVAGRPAATSQRK
ncbi:Glycosyltransferases involved in cell wall biogenesis [Mesorhizobium sp. J18]|uniref:glycosyltransferase family 2 protein n=1 Tax=Mesorhizobium sp. J18 TaxID=935263 RepID=UPI00119B62A9|nr:glycosyltransferase [Mesorhizobium sp. J18]TWG89608.1 Glycosyltransferases involved in cell wall biogenesis [Mesorhizobium sp. J18]